MLFQVIEGRSGRVVMQTEHESCVPSDEEIAAMRKAGYRTKKDSKGRMKASYRTEWSPEELPPPPEPEKEEEIGDATDAT